MESTINFIIAYLLGSIISYCLFKYAHKKFKLIYNRKARKINILVSLMSWIGVFINIVVMFLESGDIDDSEEVDW